jgi:hypothetical protein
MNDNSLVNVVSIVLIGVLLVAIFQLTGCGHSFDCGIKNQVHTDELLEWCSNDPSQDFTKNVYGQTRDWKDGAWKR